MEQSVGTSLNLGVSPARTTLSEHAMHSIISGKRKFLIYQDKNNNAKGLKYC
jgi:hypothetical protein